MEAYAPAAGIFLMDDAMAKGQCLSAMIKLIESFPETQENLEFLKRERAKAEERSRLLSSEEKQKRAQATFRKVLKALLNGSGKIGS